MSGYNAGSYNDGVWNDDVTASGAFTVGGLTLAGVGASGSVTATGAFTVGAMRMAGTGESNGVSATGWQVRAVTSAGTLVNLVAADVIRVARAINGHEQAELAIPIDHPDASILDLFSHEVQIWLDGSVYFWGRPARIDASRTDRSDQLAIVCDGLFSYFYDEVVGGERENHVTSPHEDASAVGASPTSWTKTSAVEAAAIVDNNAEFWQSPKAIQVNNSEADQDAYIYQRYTVPAELDGVPFAVMATAYIADDHAGAPAYGGAAYNDRGLVLLRLDSGASTVLSDPQVARITNETPRNQVVRLETDSVLPATGQVLEVRCYAPDAYTVWRFVGLYDGRAVKVDRLDKAEAVRVLVEHAQDTTLGKQDHSITTDIVLLGEKVSREWPWWRRDNIGEQISELADTFEFEVEITSTTRTVRVREQVGTVRSDVLTKADFHAWGLGAELGNAYSRVIAQGDGSGITRDEWWASNSSALNGNVREQLVFAPIGMPLAQLRDHAADQLSRVQSVAKLPRATISGDLAAQIRPGDTVTVDLDHGWAQWTGAARATQVVLRADRTAELHLEAAA